MSQSGGSAAPDESMHGHESMDEELRAGAAHSPPRWLAPVIVAVVIVAAGVVLLIRAGGDDRPAARADRSTAATASSSPGTSPLTSFATPIPVTTIPLVPGSTLPVAACTAPSPCDVSDLLPRAVPETLRRYFPTARVTRSSTTTAVRGGRQTLVRRTITAVADRRKIDIVLTPYVLGPDDFERNVSARSSIAVFRGTTYGGTGTGASVQLVLTEPVTERSDDLVVLRLARDPRLATLK